jgi:hypothetical protein
VLSSPLRNRLFFVGARSLHVEAPAPETTHPKDSNKINTGSSFQTQRLKEITFSSAILHEMKPGDRNNRKRRATSQKQNRYEPLVDSSQHISY